MAVRCNAHLRHRVWCLVLLSLSLFVETVGATAPLHICGIQSNDDALDSSYASSMVYDAKSHRVFVTGVTYGSYFDPRAMKNDEDDGDETSDCFVGILQLPMGEDHNLDPVWLRRVTIGEPNISESCSDIFTGDRDTSREIYLVGHSERSLGILASLYPDLAALSDNPGTSPAVASLYPDLANPSTSPAVYGMLLDLTWSADLKGGRLIYSDAVQYPVAVAASSGMEDIFVATSTANTTEIDPSFSMWAELQNITQIDSTTAGGYLPPKYGSRFAASIQKLNTTSEASLEEDSNSLQESLKAIWDLKVGQDDDLEEFSVQISSLLHVSDELLVLAGSTRGAGASFGGMDVDQSLDGFLTVLDPGTGDVIRSKRIQSSNNSADRILGMCHRNDDIFVVGMTDGNMFSDGQTPASPVQPGFYQAFIQKVSIVTLEVLWTYQLGAYLEEDEEVSTDHLPHIHGLACAVTPDGKQVYLAGTAKNGANITLDGSAAATSSAGKDDIFIAQLQSSDGGVVWVKQMGTTEDDSLAHGRGIVCDKDGHAILLGNTQGSFLQEKLPKRVGTTNDMMVIMVDRITGEHMEPIDSTGTGNDNESITEEVNMEIPETQVGDVNFTQVSEQSSGLQLENLTDVVPNLPPASRPSVNPYQPQVQIVTETKYKTNDDAILLVALVLLLNVVVVSLVMLIYIRCKNGRKKRRVGTHFTYFDGNGESSATHSSSGRTKSNSVGRTKSNSVGRTQSNSVGRTKSNSNSVYHEDLDCISFASASFASGMTLRSMPGHGQLPPRGDALLRLEPQVEPYTVSRNIISGQRMNSYRDAYDSLYDASRCMSTTGEGSDQDPEEIGMEIEDDSIVSEIQLSDSLLGDLLSDLLDRNQSKSPLGEDDSIGSENEMQIV
jgi:hypothetical protein